VYGRQDIYDAAAEYEIPEHVQKKMYFTGYLPRKQTTDKTRRKTRKKFCVRDQEKMIVVTAGGGGDGFQMMDTYLSMYESNPVEGLKSILITGPFMPRSQRRHLAKKAKPFHVKVLPFYPRMEEMFGAADLVVSMGGYNTVCEILSQATPSLIIPRETPRKEQLLRAQALKNQQLIDFVPWPELNPQNLRDKLVTMLDNLDSYKVQISGFQLDGIDFIKDRLHKFRNSLA
jgi:predicted glycosyltransferase